MILYSLHTGILIFNLLEYLRENVDFQIVESMAFNIGLQTEYHARVKKTFKIEITMYDEKTGKCEVINNLEPLQF